MSCPSEVHVAQTTALAVDLYVPAGHAVHPHSVAAAWVPASHTAVFAQSVHTEFWVAVHWERKRRDPQSCVPGVVHAAQSALPAAALYVLVAHVAHSHPVDSGCCPAEHSLVHAAQ